MANAQNENVPTIFLSQKRNFSFLASEHKKCIVCIDELKTRRNKKCLNCESVYCKTCFQVLEKCFYCKCSICFQVDKTIYSNAVYVLPEEEMKRKQKTIEKFSCDCKLNMLYKDYKNHISACKEIQIKCIKCNFAGCRNNFSHSCEIELIKLNFDKLAKNIKQNLISGLKSKMKHEEFLSPQILVFTGDLKGNIYMLELETGEELNVFKSNSSAIVCMLPFIDNSKKLKVAISHSGVGVNILDVNTKSFSSLLTDRVARVFTTVTLKKRGYLLISYCQGFIEIRDIENYDVLLKFEDYNQPGNKNVFVLSSSNTDNQFNMCSYTFESIQHISVNLDELSLTCTCKYNPAYYICCSINGKLGNSAMFYVGVSNNSIEVRSGNNLMYTLIGHKAAPCYLKYLSKYKSVEDVLVSMSKVGELIIWNIKLSIVIYSESYTPIFKKQSPVNIHHNTNSDELLILFASDKNALVKRYITDYSEIETTKLSNEGVTCIYSISKEI